MLKSIEITNSSGISNLVKLNFSKGKQTFKEEYIYKDIISPAVIYGRNSSGKTSVLKTILNIINIFSGDLTENSYYAIDNIFYDDSITKIKLYFQLSCTDYIYEVHVKDKNIIVKEEVTIDGKSSYMRDENSIRISNPSNEIRKYIKEELKSSGQNGKEINIINSKISFIRQLGIDNICEDITEIYNYFKSFRFIATNKNISSIGMDDTLGDLLVKHNGEYSKYLSHLPEMMDLEFEVKKEFQGERIVAHYKKNNSIYDFDYETMISSGTKDFYSTLALLLSLKPGSLLVIDEIEKTFHPELLDVLVREIIANMDIQVICSSHNTHLLQALRPDQIFFTKKENEVIKVDRLSEIHPGIREIHNIEKLYLGGRFE